MWTPFSGRSLLVALGLGALGLGALSGCFACELRGCDSGLLVQLTPTPPPTEPYRVELLVPGAQEPSYAYECDRSSACPSSIIRFPDLLPLRVWVRVTMAGDSRITKFTNVDYETSSPNGRSCGPTCVHAIVTAEVPS